MEVIEPLQFGRYVAALIIVIGLMVLLSHGLKLLSHNQKIIPGLKKRRLQILETLPLDQRNRILLIRRDDKEHLVLIGAQQHCVIETNIPHREGCSDSLISQEPLNEDK
jgi:flagellar protein FliO/FliZ